MPSKVCPCPVCFMANIIGKIKDDFFMKIETMLKSDRKFTKAELQALTPDAFIEYDKAIKKIDSEDMLSVKEISDQLIQERDDSVWGRYVSGSISMIRRPHEDNINMQNLLVSFYEIHNWAVVKFLCDKILALNENKFALRALADCYEETGHDNDKWPIYVRLVKIDFEERKLTKKLADHYMEIGDQENAILYYRRSLMRFISAKELDNIRTIWSILLNNSCEDFGYYLGVAEKASLQISHSFATELLNDLLKMVSNDINRSIAVLKKEIELDKDNVDAQSALILAFQKKYSTSTRLKQCIKRSGLKSGSPDFSKAIDAFETDIAFDNGSFVYQQSLDRLGVIKAISEKEVVINFGKSEVKMSADMAFRALTPLAKSNIRVLRAVVPQKLAAKVKADTRWALMTIMESHNSKCSLKEMKSDLCPKVLTEKEWNEFKKDAKKVLMEDPYFSVVIGENETYTLRSTPITPEEKKLMLFKGENDFYGKVKHLRDFVNENYDTESDSFAEMIRFFNFTLKSRKNGVNDEVVSSYLLLSILRSHDHISTATVDDPVEFATLYKSITDKVALFNKINNAELKKAFLDNVIDTDKSWADILKKCFPYYTYSYIPERLRSLGQTKVYIEILRESIENYKDMADVLLWNLKNASEKEWEKAGVSEETRIITLLLLLDYTASCVELKKDVTENKKRNALIEQVLFTEKKIYEAIEMGTQELATKIYSIIANDKNIDPGKKVSIKYIISEKYPDFRFFDDEAPVQSNNLIPTGFLCTKKCLDEKLKEKDHIEHVELLEVADEIADARALGDLRENAEYQYGKDKQKNLNARLRTLSEEIEKAQVITPDKVDPSKISFGTKVKMMDNLQKKEITYTILGQWESDPDRYILNFKTPLGMSLLNKVVGDELKFEINGTKYDYTILSIEVADF